MSKFRQSSKLVFPSGRTEEQVRKDAKRLKISESISYTEALNKLARKNGIHSDWATAIKQLVVKDRKPESHEHINPYRNLLAYALNEILNRGCFSLQPSKIEKGHFFTEIGGHTSAVLWNDAGFDEVRISVWWKYEHTKHPQKDSEGSCRESFSSTAPLARKELYKNFVGVVASAWLERREGAWLQGHGNQHLMNLYTRKGEMKHLKELPSVKPNGYSHEGRILM